MKSKIVAALLCLAVLVPQSVFASDEYIYENVKLIYGWRIQDSGYEYDESTGSGDTVNFVSDPEYGRVLMTDKQSAAHQNSFKGVIQDIPTDILEDGHTYIAEYDFKMSQDQTYVRAGFNVPRGYSQLNSQSCAEWARRSNRYTYDADSFSGDNLELIFYNMNNAGKFYLANVTVYDEADPDKTNILTNGDFSYEYTTVQDVDFSDGILTWAIPEDTEADGINVYKRELDGEKEKLNEEIIPMADGKYEFEISDGGSYFIDVYSCVGDIELSWQSPAVYTVTSGAAEILDYRFYSGGEELESLTPGTVTVSLPFRNNNVGEGYDMEIIVLLKDGKYTRRVSHAAYKVMPSEEVGEYSVDIDVDGEIDEDTCLEVYLWDGIDTMNVLKDMYTFPLREG